MLKNSMDFRDSAINRHVAVLFTVTVQSSRPTKENTESELYCLPFYQYSIGYGFYFTLQIWD